MSNIIVFYLKWYKFVIIVDNFKVSGIVIVILNR